jgi:hypothetical protein
VSHLVIMPDIEKRLEAFVRLGHGIVIFPGGAGTTEEILYLLGVLLDPRNAEQPLPLIVTGPVESAGYFAQLQEFLSATLGATALERFRIIIADPPAVARELARALDQVRAWRKRTSDSYNFNWLLHVPHELQKPFEVTHESMRSLKLDAQQPVHVLAANLRRLFSGIVAGNVKEYGIRAIERLGPFEVHGDRAMVSALDKLLTAYVAERRMQITGDQYRPCYRLVA